MPNSYSVVPNVLPGNVTVGGDLTITGSVIRLGSGPPFARLARAGGGNLLLTNNLASDLVTRDDAAQAANVLDMFQSTAPVLVRRMNAAGNFNDAALTLPIFTDYTQHAHTGTVTEDTIYTKVIRGGIIGANGGLHIRMFLSASAQGAPATTFRFRFGAVLCESDAITATSARWYEFYLWNQNAANSNRHLLRVHNLTTNALSNANGTDTFDFSVDQTLNITVQNGTATDTQTFLTVGAQLINSFGPV